MASSRVTCKAQCTRTYGAGKDYTALPTWEADIDVNLDALTTVDADSNSGQPVLNVAATQVFGADSFRTGDTVVINNGGAREEVREILSVQAGISITFTENLTNTHTAVQADIVASCAVLECYSGTYDDYCTFLDGTTTTDFFPLVCPAAGNGHDGTPGSGVIFSRTASLATFAFTRANVYLEDIVVKGVASTISAITSMIAIGPAGGGAHIVGCIVCDGVVNNASYDLRGINVANTSGNVYIVNTLVHNIVNTNAAKSGIGIRTDATAVADTTFVYNTTVTGCEYGFFSNKRIIAKNCAPTGNTVDWGNPGATYYTITTSTGEGASPTYVNSAGDDFHLDPTDIVCIDQGTNLSSDPNFPFDDDIDGDARSAPWDIGFDGEYDLPTTTTTSTTAAPTTTASPTTTTTVGPTTTAGPATTTTPGPTTTTLQPTTTTTQAPPDDFVLYYGCFDVLPTTDSIAGFTAFTGAQYPLVEIKENTYVAGTYFEHECISQTLVIMGFFDAASEEFIPSALVDLRSSVAGDDSVLFFQIWNEDTQLWETLISDNTTNEGVTVSFSQSKNTNVADYWEPLGGGEYRCKFRYYQDSML